MDADLVEIIDLEVLKTSRSNLTKYHKSGI
jgi:hypothetical protein